MVSLHVNKTVTKTVTVNSVVVNTAGSMFLSHTNFISFTDISRSGVGGSQGSSGFSFLRTPHCFLGCHCSFVSFQTMSEARFPFLIISISKYYQYFHNGCSKCSDVEADFTFDLEWMSRCQGHRATGSAEPFCSLLQPCCPALSCIWAMPLAGLAVLLHVHSMKVAGLFLSTRFPLAKALMVLICFLSSTALA